MTSIFRLKFNNLAPFEKKVFVTLWSKECHVMLVMNFPKLTNINHKRLQRTANEYAEERRFYKDLISKNNTVEGETAVYGYIPLCFEFFPCRLDVLQS